MREFGATLHQPGHVVVTEMSLEVKALTLTSDEEIVLSSAKMINEKGR